MSGESEPGQETRLEDEPDERPADSSEAGLETKLDAESVLGSQTGLETDLVPLLDSQLETTIEAVWSKETCVREVVRAWDRFRDKCTCEPGIEDADVVAWHEPLEPDLKAALRAQALERRFLNETVQVTCPQCESSQKVPRIKSRQQLACPVCQSTFTPQQSSTRRTPRRKRPDEAEEPGDSIAKYELESLLGRGAFGRVWKAFDTNLRRTVALKISHESDEKHRDRFFREAQAVAALNHPGIVPVYASGETDGQLWIALEFVEGRTLLQVLYEAGGVLPAQQAAEFCVPLARALDHAHQNKVVHRDVKPQNILVDGTGTPRLVDFGLAKMTDRSRLSHTAETMGTLSYMPPEQLGTQRRKARAAAEAEEQVGDVILVTGRADVYSLGAVLYELLTGHPPFEAANAAGMIAQILDAAPVSPRLKNPLLPEDISQICLKCLHKDEADRYESAGALADDLQRFLAADSDRPVQAKSLSAAKRVWRWCQREPRRARTYVGSGLAVLSAIVVSFVLVNEARIVARDARDTSEQRRAETINMLGVAQDSLGRSLQLGEAFEAVPEMQAAWRAFLEHAAGNYEFLAQRESDDPDLELHRARVWLTLVDIRHDLGDLKGARQAVDKARSILDVVRTQRDDNDALIELANADSRLAELALANGQAEEALKLSEQSLLALRGLADGERIPLYARFSLAAAYLNQGSLLLQLGSTRKAEVRLTEAATRFQTLVESEPEDASFVAGLASTLTLLGRAASGQGEHSKAAEQINQGLTVVDAHIEEYGADMFLLMSLAAGQEDLARALDAAGRTDEALSQWERCVATWAGLAARDQSMPRYYEMYVSREIDCGQALHDAGRVQRAHPFLTDALDRITQMNSDEDENLPPIQEQDLWWMGLQGRCLDALGRVESDRGKLDEALEMFTQAQSAFDALTDSNAEDSESAFRAILVRNHRGQVLHRLGESGAGLTLIREAEARLGDFVPNHGHWTLIDLAREQAAFCARERGVILHEAGESEQARQAFLAAADEWASLVAETGRPRFRNNLAVFLIECPDESIRDTGQAISLSRGLITDVRSNPAYSALHGAALTVAGNHEEAVEVLAAITEKYPQRRARDWFYLALSQSQLGRKQASQDSLQQGIDWMDRELPHDPWLMRLRRVVEQAVGTD